MTPSDPGARRPPEVAGRLHPLTLLVFAWDVLKRVLIPAVVILAFRPGETGLLIVWSLFLIPAFVAATVRYVSFRYRVDPGELVVRQGVVQRTERHVRLDRVQDLRMEQRLLHRLLGVATVHVETAAGEGPEASLAVLSVREARRLREAVLGGRGEALGDDAGAERPQVLARVGARELLLGGLTATRLASVFVVLGGVLAFAEDVVPDLHERAARALGAAMQQGTDGLPETTAAAALGAGALLALGLVVAAAVISVISQLVLFHGFRLSLDGDDLRRTYGLFTRRSSSLPRRRVQVLAIQESLARRLFGLAVVRADSAAGRERKARSSGRDVLLPVVRRRRVAALLPHVFPDLPAASPTWHRVSPRAVRRATVRAALLLALAAAGLSAATGSPWGLVILALVVPAHVAARIQHRHLGFALGDGFLWTRRGWLSRVTHVVPVRNVQAVVTWTTPFDRRLGLARLVVDTAGQAYTGGGPRIADLEAEDARRLADELAREASRLRYLT